MSGSCPWSKPFILDAAVIVIVVSLISSDCKATVCWNYLNSKFCCNIPSSCNISLLNLKAQVVKFRRFFDHQIAYVIGLLSSISNQFEAVW